MLIFQPVTFPSLDLKGTGSGPLDGAGAVWASYGESLIALVTPGAGGTSAPILLRGGTAALQCASYAGGRLVETGPLPAAGGALPLPQAPGTPVVLCVRPVPTRSVAPRARSRTGRRSARLRRYR